MITLTSVRLKLKWSETHVCHCMQIYKSLHSLCFEKMYRSAFFTLNVQLGLKLDGLGFLVTILLATA